MAGHVVCRVPCTVVWWAEFLAFATCFKARLKPNGVISRSLANPLTLRLQPCLSWPFFCPALPCPALPTPDKTRQDQTRPDGVVGLRCTHEIRPA
ncbi:hypothetical protein BC567DRAFT_231237 [Phyllosticta citribraziliensis]